MVIVTLNAVINGLMYGSIWGVIALGFTLIFGVMNFVNFAQGHFVMLSAYFAYFLFTVWCIDPYVSLLLIIPLFFVLGFLMYRYLGTRLIDLPHNSHIIATLALGLLIENFLLLFLGGDLRSVMTSYTTSSFFIGPMRLSHPRLGASIVAWLCVAGLYGFLRYTETGKAIRATADNKRGARIVGIHVDRVYLIAFGLSIMVAGSAGAVMIPFFLVGPFSGMDFLVKAFSAVVIGGLGSIPGAIAGGLIIGLVESVSSVFLSASYGNAISCLIMILVLIFKPSGLFGEGG